MPPRLLAAACAGLMLAACQADTPGPTAAAPQAGSGADADTPAAPAASPPAVEAMSATADDGSGILRVTTARGSVDCSGRHVEVLATNAELAFTGQCLELYFLGANTRASIQGAALVQVGADHVALEIATPVAELRQLGDAGQHRVDAVEGEVYVTGDGNRIDARSVGAVNLVGSRNQVHWQAGEPAVSDLGTGNVVGLE